MNFLSSATRAQHDHPGQKVLEYLAQLQQQNALLKKALALSQKENALQQDLIARLEAQSVQQQEQISQLQEKVEVLKAEILRLKKLPPPQPDIKPNTKPPDDSDDSSGDPPAADQSDEADPEGVSTRKVSKPDESRDTFVSLNKTCRLRSLSFWDYLTNQLSGALFPRLGEIIENVSSLLPCGLSKVTA